MGEENFWILLEASRPKIGCAPDEQAKLMTDLLAKKDREQIIDFENIRLSVLHRLYTWPLLKANFIVLGYVSDDVFEDFRHWIILNGRENYEKTLANPNCLHEYIHVDNPIEEIIGEPLLYVAENAWTIIGQEEDIMDFLSFPTDPIVNDEWPSKEKLREEFPDLFQKFWNEDAIGHLDLLIMAASKS
jgi:Protein of unknown function (DUF4240)